jgi:GTP cyclohydrolase I
MKKVTDTTPPDTTPPMPDVQSQADDREIPLAKVGVKGLEYPIRVLDKVKKVQYTAAKVDLFANLPQHFKGTHMSRFVEIFHRYREDLSMSHFLKMLDEIKGELEAESAYGSLEFPYYVEKLAPVSRLPGIIACQCRYRGRVSGASGGEGGPEKQFTVAVSVPVCTVCPCSKAISGRGAHNQRGIVTAELELGPFFWLEDIIELIEKSASSPVYSILKREDEKYVTERAYDNPKFAEDLVRDVYARIRDLGQFPRFSVEAENFESIHNHSAYAFAEGTAN